MYLQKMAGISATHRWNVHQFTRTILEHVNSARQEVTSLLQLRINLNRHLLPYCERCTASVPSVSTYPDCISLTKAIYFIMSRAKKTTLITPFNLCKMLFFSIFLGEHASILIKGIIYFWEWGRSLILICTIIQFLYGVVDARTTAWRRGVTLF